MSQQSHQTAQSLEKAVQPKWLFLTILAMMSVGGLIGSDVYLPAMPAMAHYFSHSMQAIQLTLGLYLLGLSVGQLIYGPLTESLGRKKLLIIGVAIYLLASLSCFLAVNYWQLLISRFLQALGACSGLIIGRAIVGDIYNQQEAGRIFSTIFPVVGMSPAISPAIGGVIAHYFGWRGTFAVVSLFAFSLLALILIFLPETHRVDRYKWPKLGAILHSYKETLFKRSFLIYVFAPCFAYITYFGYIAQSPFIFHQNGFTELEIGFFYITLSLCYVAGNLVGKRCLQSYNLDSILACGYIIFTLGGLGIFLTGLFNWPLFLIVLFISVLTFGNGQLIPLGVAGVITSFPKSKGYASALLGFLQLGSAGISTAIVGRVTNNSLLGLGLYVFVFCLLGALLFFALLPKHIMLSKQEAKS